MTEVKIDVKITRYSVVDGQLDERVSIEQTTAYVLRDYLRLGNCAGSAPVGRLREDVERGHLKEWFAQIGTKPIYIDPCAGYFAAGCQWPCGQGCDCGPGDYRGGWGGRNYPQVVVSADELLRALEALT